MGGGELCVVARRCFCLHEYCLYVMLKAYSLNEYARRVFLLFSVSLYIALLSWLQGILSPARLVCGHVIECE